MHRQGSRIACAVVVLTVMLSGCGRAGGQPFQPALNTPLRLDSAIAIGQTLNPPRDTIARLDLSLATFGEPADPEGQLTVTLRPVEGSATATTTQIGGSQITDGTWAAARFEPPVVIDGVALAEVTWTGSTPLAVWADVPLEATVGITNDPYPAGQLVIDGRPAAGDLAFRVTGGGGVRAAVDQVGQVLRTAGARLLAQPVFTALWLVAVLGVAWLALAGFKSSRAATHERRATTTSPSAR